MHSEFGSCIDIANIAGYYSNFGKAGYDVVDTFGLPYDYNSLMHYPGNAFAKPNKNVTIISKVRAVHSLSHSLLDKCVTNKSKY